MRALAGTLALLIATPPLAAVAAPPATTPEARAAAPSAPTGGVVRRTDVVDVGGVRGYVRTDAAALLAGVELVVRAGLDRQTGSENGVAALVAETVLRTPVSDAPNGAAGPPVPLADAVEARGASIGYAIGLQSVRFYLEGPPDALAATAPLVARALRAPSFADATLAAARASLAERLSDEDSDPRLIGRAMLRTSYYRGSAGLPPFANAAALAAVTPAAAQAFHARWYLRGGATVAAVGRTGDATSAASSALVAALPEGGAPSAPLTTRPPAANAKRIVTHRDVSAPYVVLGFAAPSLGERDFAAALVVRTLLASLFGRPGATTPPPAFRAGGTIYGYDAAPAQMIVWMNGSRIDAETGLAALLVVIKSAGAKPLSAAALSRFKETARGEWALETMTLDDRARAIADASLRGLDADAGDGVRAAIAGVTAADVQRVAKKYFQKFDLALILPRDG
ncbi:MAG TPA: insulinase family protein [Candidatus Elarobacter sp.]|jgi:predicted Zn-dependent peptidase